MRDTTSVLVFLCTLSTYTTKSCPFRAFTFSNSSQSLLKDLHELYRNIAKLLSFWVSITASRIQEGQDWLTSVTTRSLNKIRFSSKLQGRRASSTTRSMLHNEGSCLFVQKDYGSGIFWGQKNVIVVVHVNDVKQMKDKNSELQCHPDITEIERDVQFDGWSNA